MDHNDRDGLVLVDDDGHHPDDAALQAEHDHVIDILRAHRHLTVAPGPLRDWYRTTALAGLPHALDPY